MAQEAPYFKLTRPSKSSGKKWQLRVPTRSGRGKVVAFGDASMEDYTIHKDKDRRENYRSRHRKDHINDPYKPGFWSWWSLWGESSNLKTAHAAAVRRAKQILKRKGVDVGVDVGGGARRRENPNPPDAPVPTMAEVSGAVAALDVPKNLRAEFMRGFAVEWEHAHTVNYDILTIGRIVLDHLAEDARYYRKLQRARLNPAEPSERVRSCFDALLSVVHEQYPDLVCTLVVSEDAGLRGGERCARAYAYCTPLDDGSYVIHVAPKIEEAEDSRIDGLLRHEFAHAVLIHTGDEEHTERDADEIAEDLFGSPLYYDEDDVQTTDPSAPGARRPRPEYLDDEHGRTLDIAPRVNENARENGETMRLETADDVLEALDNAAATGDHKTPRIIASQLSQQAKEVAGAQGRMLLCLARAARHCANAVEARLAGNIEHAMSCERLCERAIGEAQSPGRSNPHALRKDWLDKARKAGRNDAVNFGSAIAERRDYLAQAGWRDLDENDRKALLRAWEQGVSDVRGNPEWAKKLGRGIYKGARYTAETARDLYRGAREAHGEHDEHEADEEVLPGDATRSNPLSPFLRQLAPIQRKTITALNSGKKLSKEQMACLPNFKRWKIVNEAGKLTAYGKKLASELSE